MIGIIGGGLAAAKLVESYRESGGEDEITMWSQDPHGPYHRPPLSKKVLRGEAKPEDALVHPQDWYAENGVDLRLGVTISGAPISHVVEPRTDRYEIHLRAREEHQRLMQIEEDT